MSVSYHILSILSDIEYFNNLNCFAKSTIPPQSFALHDTLSTMLETFSYHAFISDTFELYYSQPCLTVKSLIQGMKQGCLLQLYYILNVFQKQKISYEGKENL